MRIQTTLYKKRNKSLGQGASYYQWLKTTFVIQKESVAIILATLAIFTCNVLNSKAVRQVKVSQKITKNNSINTPDVYNFFNISVDTKHSTPHNQPITSFRVGYVDLTNTGVMYISSGTIMALEGSITTSASGNTENNGTLYIKGDFTNNGTYTRDNGNVIFWDLDDQLINGSSSTIFYNAELNKSPGKVTMSSNLEVANNLNLINGRLDLNTFTLTISNSATSAISYTNGYVKSELVDNSSKLQWNIGSTTGAHVIPFGTISDIVIPLTLDLTVGTIGNVTASTYPTAANNTPYPTTPELVIQMRDSLFNDNSANVVDRFWQINKTGGSGTVTATFTYAPGEEPANGETNLVAQLYNQTYNGWVTPFSSQSANTTNNTVTAPGVSNFGPFALSKSSSPLPIQLLKFKAKVNDQKHVDVDWITASEINNEFFTIQRSKDLVNIEDLKIVDGANTSSQTHYYHYTDEHPLANDCYYRIKQTDYDGKFIYSSWSFVSINTEIGPSELTIEKVYPNPFIDVFTIDYSIAKKGDVTLQLINETGQLIFSEKINASESKNTYTYSNYKNISKGIYYFIIRYNETIKTIKVVKNN